VRFPNFANDSFRKSGIFVFSRRGSALQFDSDTRGLQFSDIIYPSIPFRFLRRVPLLSTLHTGNNALPRFCTRLISLEESPILVVSVSENRRGVVLRRTSEKSCDCQDSVSSTLGRDKAARATHFGTADSRRRRLHSFDRRYLIVRKQAFLRSRQRDNRSLRYRLSRDSN